MRQIALSIAAATLAVPTMASAESIPTFRDLEITYTGTLVEAVEDTLRVRLADGSIVDYSGPLPAYPIQPGEEFQLSFTASVPTSAYYDVEGYPGPVNADGTYSILAQPFYYSGGGLSTANVSPGTIETNIGFVPVLNLGQPTNLQMTLNYDPATDTYYIDDSERFFTSALSGPGYLFDNGEYVLCGFGTSGPNCSGIAGSDPVIAGFSSGADINSISTGNIPIRSTDGFFGEGTGVFSLDFLGSWNLPLYSTREPAPVPAPGMLLLFGAGVAAMAWRRRKQTV